MITSYEDEALILDRDLIKNENIRNEETNITDFSNKNE